MHKWIVEQWRDGERVRRMEFTEDMIQQHDDGTVVITFPSKEMAGGLVIATNDELHLSEMDDGEP
jgi:hypothetical protein